MDVDSDGFQLVSSRRWQSKRKKLHRLASNQHSDAENCTSSLVRLMNSVQNCRLDLDGSDFKRDFEATALKAGIFVTGTTDGTQDDLLRIEKIVSYGIGNYSVCPIARYQFAFLTIIRELLEVEEKHCYLYDPVFSTSEREGVLKWGFQLIRTNEEGKRHSDERTLFYMPHCSKALYNNLVWANWDPVHLGNTIIVGNSFSGISESIPDREFKNDLHCISKALTLMREFPLTNTFLHKDIFNNTSLHIFHGALMMELEQDAQFWLKTEEPEYKDTEIITASPSKITS